MRTNSFLVLMITFSNVCLKRESEDSGSQTRVAEFENEGLEV